MIETVLWSIIGVLTIGTGITVIAVLVAMSHSRYRG